MIGGSKDVKMKTENNLAIKKTCGVNSLFRWNKTTFAVSLQNKGITLIELLVAVTIFAIVIAAISGLILSGIRMQRIFLNTQADLDQVSYAIEYMSRAIRMARKQLTPTPECPTTCLTQEGLNYEIFDNGREIRFQNYDCICQRFMVDSSLGPLYLYEDKGWELSGGLPTFVDPQPLIFWPINSIKFEIAGQNQPPDDYLQPSITIFIDLGGDLVSRVSSQFQIQTTVSQRNLDVRY